MKITALDGRTGAEVTDFDLASDWTSSPDELKAIRDAFATRHLLLIRDLVSRYSRWKESPHDGTGSGLA